MIKGLVGLAAFAAVAGAGAAARSPSDWLGAWRIERGVVAPWAPMATPISRDFLGKSVTFADSSMKGPGPLDCKGAAYEPTSVPAEGLFQSGIVGPAEEAAARLGLVSLPVAGMSLTCDTGVFEFHAADADTMLFALSNVIWTISRAEGALARPSSPEGAVQSLLEAHFAGNMGFTEESVAAKRGFLTKALGAKIDAYFTREFPEDEVPPIDGDPFTDTQEYPTRFAVRAAAREKTTADVPADFSDGYATRRVRFKLIKSGKRWRLDDLIYEDGATLTALLLAPN